MSDYPELDRLGVTGEKAREILTGLKGVNNKPATHHDLLRLEAACVEAESDFDSAFADYEVQRLRVERLLELLMSGAASIAAALRMNAARDAMIQARAAYAKALGKDA